MGVTRNEIIVSDGSVFLSHLDEPKLAIFGVVDFELEESIVTITKEDAIKLREMLTTFISQAMLAEFTRAEGGE